jgi:hypothetical protein
MVCPGKGTLRGSEKEDLMRWLVIALLALLATACTSGSPARDSGGPLAAASFDKVNVELGTVDRTQDGVEAFLAINHTDAPLRFGPVTVVAEEGCSQVEAVTTTGEIPPHSVAKIGLRFGKHDMLGPHRIRATVPFDDPDKTVGALSVSFTVKEDPLSSGAGPRLRVDKQEVNIGTVPLDWPLYEQFTLRNDGDAPLDLTADPVLRVEQGC